MDIVTHLGKPKNTDKLLKAFCKYVTELMKSGLRKKIKTPEGWTVSIRESKPKDSENIIRHLDVEWGMGAAVTTLIPDNVVIEITDKHIDVQGHGVGFVWVLYDGHERVVGVFKTFEGCLEHKKRRSSDGFVGDVIHRKQLLK